MLYHPPMTTLITGTAGFIGSNVAMRLLARGERVIGFDNLNDYYDVALKKARLARFADHPNYVHVQADLADRAAVEACFATHRPTRVVHLAAQAGVRYAAENPHVYVSSNVTGFLHVLEGCRHHGVGHLVFASTALTQGSWTSTWQLNLRSSLMMSMTRVLRRSGQFSLKVRPSTSTRAPTGLIDLAAISRSTCVATWAPMPSLMRRPARMTSGW